MARVLLLALLLVAAPSAAAARTCTVGKPCGNTCIAKDKVCYVGSVGPAIDMRGREAAAIWMGGAIVVATLLIAATSVTVWHRTSSVEVQLSGDGVRLPNLIEVSW